MSIQSNAFQLCGCTSCDYVLKDKNLLCSYSKPF